MNKLFLVLIILQIATITAYGQQIDYNMDTGYIANGYDVVAYFSNKAVKGKKDFAYNYDNANYKFSSKNNLEKFKANPKIYIPQYGAWCAYAMADKGEKVSINPKTFEIRNGKLYLFYNAFFNNTLDNWLNEMPVKLIKKADSNWEKIRFKSE